MGDIIKEMNHQMPKRFCRFDIFLATYMAMPAVQQGVTV